jgi:hypothetical protein
MQINPSDNVPEKVQKNRNGEAQSVRGPVRKPTIAQKATESVLSDVGDNPISEIRKQILILQRSLSRQQSILGGFEGFRSLLDSSITRPGDFIGDITYRGEAVLVPYRDRLEKIFETGDRAALERLISASRRIIDEHAIQLSRLQTAEQNSRSLAPSQTPLSSILQGIENAGDLLLKLEAENVLDLLS